MVARVLTSYVDKCKLGKFNQAVNQPTACMQQYTVKVSKSS